MDLTPDVAHLVRLHILAFLAKTRLDIRLGELWFLQCEFEKRWVGRRVAPEDEVEVWAHWSELRERDARSGFFELDGIGANMDGRQSCEVFFGVECGGIVCRCG